MSEVFTPVAEGELRHPQQETNLRCGGCGSGGRAGRAVIERVGGSNPGSVLPDVETSLGKTLNPELSLLKHSERWLGLENAIYMQEE